MSEHNERWVLNRLIEMCRDEEESLRYLASGVRDPVRKLQLFSLADRRAQFAADLVPHAQRLGGWAPHDGTARAAWSRRWRTIRDAFRRQDDRARMTKAQHEEERILAMYGGALDRILPPGTRDLVERQEADVRRSHGQMKEYLTH